MDATERHSALLVQLSEGITALTTSDEWIRHLDVQSRFHHYSFGNVVLIAAQRPGASQVAGFRSWLKLGRNVRKGEKAIWILAPMGVRKTEEDDSGEARVIVGFKYVPVFDISQTEGAELPPACRKLVGDEPLVHIGRLTGAADSLGYSVQSTELPDGVNGDCSFELRRIRVERRNTPAQRVKTLAHDPLTAPVVVAMEDYLAPAVRERLVIEQSLRLSAHEPQVGCEHRRFFNDLESEANVEPHVLRLRCLQP